MLLAWRDERKVTGGRTYDGHILTRAKKGRAGRLLTLNAKDFLAFDEADIDIVQSGPREGLPARRQGGLGPVVG